MLSCSVRALQQNLEELKGINSSLKKENRTLREQLSTAKNGKHKRLSKEPQRTTVNRLYIYQKKKKLTPCPTLLFVSVRDSTRGQSVRPSCDAEFARSLKVFYHSMTSVRGQLQRLRRHRPSVCICSRSATISVISVTSVRPCGFFFFNVISNGRE